MKPIESFPDVKKCEMCGAVRRGDESDSGTDRTAAEMLRLLALVADDDSGITLALLYHLSGRTGPEIAARLKISRQAVWKKIRRARRVMG